MRLTKFSDYALRVLIYLGLHGDELTTIAEIAEAYSVSGHHLTKVVHFLSQQGYVETVRGKGGGLRLAQAPAQIGVGKVVRATEAHLSLVECFASERSACKLSPVCGLKAVFAQAEAAFYAELDGHTLADLLEPRARLRRRVLAAS